MKGVHIENIWMRTKTLFLSGDFSGNLVYFSEVTPQVFISRDGQDRWT